MKDLAVLRRLFVVARDEARRAFDAEKKAEKPTDYNQGRYEGLKEALEILDAFDEMGR
jgi:5-methylcytosine-specific restriction endonuclease McrBC GTP-binding regulatory subunit McrB